jgi:hypothetical protein
MYRFQNCCSSGPATFGQDETGSAVATEQGAMTALAPAARRDGFPWPMLFGVSVLAGLTINYLTRRRG